MYEAVDDVIQRRHLAPAGLSRAMSASLAIHIGTVLVLFLMPKDWYTQPKEEPLLMTISLGGSPGEKSGGMVSAGARPVEEVAPPPKRPEPIPPATPPKPDVIATAAKTPPKTPPKPTDSKAPSEVTKPPVTGQVITKGTSQAETRAPGVGTGLQTGGGAGGAQVEVDAAFCCKEYLEEITRRIGANWTRRTMPETGEVRIVFEILRDGTFTKPEYEKRATIQLDLASMDVFNEKLKFPRLPDQFTESRLKVHIIFPYVR